MRTLFSRCLLAAALAPLPAASFSGEKRAYGDLDFIHASDVHAPSEASRRTIKEMAGSGLELAPYGVKAGRPEFAVVSGDLTEFGGGGGTWEEYMSYWKGLGFPVYHQLGNHDGPWFSNRQYLRGLYRGECSWSFDRGGFHFIGLDTSTPHDPRANITQEQFSWLKRDLAGLKPGTPVFLVIHHPLDDAYLGSLYASFRLLDLLRPYNIAGVLTGHGHRAVRRTVYGLDHIQGGSTIGPAPNLSPGFSVVSVRDGVMRAVHKFAGGTPADQAVLEKPVPERTSYPEIEILSPGENAVYRGGPLKIKARISGAARPISGAVWLADNAEFDETKWAGAPMTCLEGVCEAEADYSGWVPGAHYVQVVFTDEAGARYVRTARFGTEPAGGRLLWRTMLGGSCRGAATAYGDTVYVGATDGRLYALDRSSGGVKWSYKTGGDVASKPLVLGDTVYFGSGDGKLYALRSDGRLKWKFKAKGGIYGAPVFAGGLVLFGADDSNFYAVRADTGKLAWVSEEPGYSIEVRPFFSGGAVYFGAWDEYVYALDLATGGTIWRGRGAGSSERPRAKRYFSPADCGPVVSGGRVFVADRDSQLGIMDAASGVLVSTRSGCVAVGLSGDGKAVYQRRPDGSLLKMSLDGSTVWASSAAVDSVPAAPVEMDGAVYSVSKLGLVQAFSALDGSLLWRYQATPMLYVLSEAEAAGGAVYVAGMDGSVTALSAAP